jgi:hypothetical protein
MVDLDIKYYGFDERIPDEQPKKTKKGKRMKPWDKSKFQK